MLHNVVFYTQPECPPCEILKRFLRAHNIAFTERNIKEDTDARDYMIKTLQSYSTPTLLINEEHVIRGFNIEETANRLNISCE